MVLRIGYIREHFSSPLLKLAAEDGGKTIELVECPGGTGQIISAFKEGSIDVGIALTDALLAGIQRGEGDYRLVGSYVTTPLNWAVIVGKDSKYTEISQLRGTTIGISRIGSGSQTMAAVMAMQQEWYTDLGKTKVELFNCKVNNNIDGLIASVNDGSTSAFMWEWFTTKPYVDRGLVRFVRIVRLIGSVPTPWPSWMIAAHSRVDSEAIGAFLTSLGIHVLAFSKGLHTAPPVGVEMDGQPVTETAKTVVGCKEEEENVQYLMETFGHGEMDVREWMATVRYPQEGDMAVLDLPMITRTLNILKQAGVVPEAPYDPLDFVRGDVSRYIE